MLTWNESLSKCTTDRVIELSDGTEAYFADVPVEMGLSQCKDDFAVQTYGDADHEFASDLSAAFVHPITLAEIRNA